MALALSNSAISSAVKVQPEAPFNEASAVERREGENLWVGGGVCDVIYQVVIQTGQTASTNDWGGHTRFLHQPSERDLCHRFLPLVGNRRNCVQLERKRMRMVRERKGRGEEVERR